MSAETGGAEHRDPEAEPATTLLELEIEDLAFGGRGLARTDGYVVFVAGGPPRRLRPRRGHEGRSGASPRRARSSCSAPGADRLPDRCLHGGEPCPGAPWQGLPYERQLDRQAAPGGRGAAPDRQASTGSSSSRSCPPTEHWRYRNKLEYTLRRARRRARCSASTPAAAGIVVVDVEDCQLASERGNATRNEVRRWASAAGLPAYDRRARAGVLRNLVVREGRRTGQTADPPRHLPGSQFPRPPVDLHTVIEGPSGRHRRADRSRSAASASPRSSAASPSRSAPRLLPDQHRDGRAPLRHRRRVRRPRGQRARLRPLLRASARSA